MTLLEPAQSPGFLLWHVTLRWQRAVTAALAPLGLTHVQFVLLACTWWLNERGDHPNQITIARQAGTDVKMASQVLRGLEAAGLLAREVDPADTRSKRLRVTRAGAQLAPRAIAEVERVDARFFAPASRATAVDLLTRLAAQRPESPPVPAEVPGGPGHSSSHPDRATAVRIQ